MTNKEKQALTLTMFDIGQAECFLIEKGNVTALIDCGNTSQGKNIVDSIKKRGINKIDYIFITHPHEDHMGGMLEIINNLQVGNIILPDINPKKVTTKWYKKIISQLSRENYQIEIAEKNKKYNLENVEIKIISAVASKGNNINNYSTVLKVTYGQNSIIMTGDAENVVENELLKTGENIKATILKVGHHGSKMATTEEFIDAVNPKYALISCGVNNTYNHPSQEVIERLNKKNIKTYRTDEQGEVVMRITEKDIEVKL